MLVIEVAKIPAEGTLVAAALDPAQMHVEGERSFTLRPGGRIDARVERGEDLSVHVRGHLGVTLELQCDRCLELYTLALEQELDLFYLRHQPGQPGASESEDEVELSDRDVVVAYYQGERLDLGDVLREQLFLSVPLHRLCRAECRGLCAVCGVNRNLENCACAPATPATPADPRLAALGRLIQKGSA